MIKRIARLLSISIFAIFLISCPNFMGGEETNIPGTGETDPTGTEEPDDTPLVVLEDSSLWGHWIRMDQEEAWYINDSSVTRDGTSSNITAVSETGFSTSSMTFSQQSDNVLMVNNAEFYLFRKAGALGNINGVVTYDDGSRNISSLGGVRLIIRNLRNDSDIKDIDANDLTGAFTAEEVIPTDEYEIDVTYIEDGVEKEGPSISVTPQTLNEDIGTIALSQEAYNFKVEGTMTDDVDYLYADGTTYNLSIRVKNIGTDASYGTTYEIPSDQPYGITFTSSTHQLLGSIPSADEEILETTVSCSDITEEYAEKKLLINIKDANSKVWEDSITLRFYREPMTFNISSYYKDVYGVIMSPEKNGTWFSTQQVNGSYYETALTLPLRTEGYVLSFSGANLSTEAVYSVGIDNEAEGALVMADFIETDAYEPNNLESLSAPIAYGDKITAYLHWTDVDFYTVGNKVQEPAASPSSGTYNTEQSVTLSCGTEEAEIRYTFNDSTPDSSSTLYSSPISLTEPTTIKAIAFKVGLEESNILTAEYTFQPVRPVVTLSEGLYSISCETSGVEIRYSVDGEEPTESSTLYTTDIDETSVTTVLKAKAFKTNWTPSETGASSGAPTATFSFSPTAPVVNEEVTFTISGQSDDDTAVGYLEYRWSFDDGVSWSAWGSSTSTIHTFTDSGDFIVQMEVRDTYQVTTTIEEIVSVTLSGAPSATFSSSPASPAVDSEATFTISSQADDDTDVADLEYRWSFDGGSTWTTWSGSTSTTHTFDSTGDFSVKLDIRDDYEVVGTRTETINVLEASAIPRDGLVAEYLFNRDATDSSGNENDGTEYGGVSLATDRFGNVDSAYSFDGVDDYIQLNFQNEYTHPTGTISVWFKAEDYFFPISFDEQVSTTYYYGIGSMSGAITDESVTISCGNNGLMIRNGETKYLDNRWHNLTVSSNGSNYQIFIDGISQTSDIYYYRGSDTGFWYTDANSFTELLLGHHLSEHGNFFTAGYIDDIRIYNRVLTETETQALYAEGGFNPSEPATSDELVAEYLFNGDASDSSGNGYDGTLYGDVTLTSDRFGNADSAYSFDGINDYILASSNPIANINDNDFSISIWFQSGELPSLASELMWFGDNLSGGEEHIEVSIRPDGTIRTTFADNAVDTSNYSDFDTINPITLSSWNHFVIKRENNNVSLILNDNIEQTSLVDIQFDSTDFGEGFSIGIREGNWDYPHNGKIDDIRIYNYALSTTEIRGLYEEGGYTPPELANSIEMIDVTGGTFTMGDTWGTGETDELPIHSVTLSDFSIGKYEVTYAQWIEVYDWAVINGYTFSSIGFAGNDGYPSDDYDEPVTLIDWKDAIVWCNAASEMESLTPVYTYNNMTLRDSQATNSVACYAAVCDWSLAGYRLPTEAEWEYTARGGQSDTNSGQYAGSSVISDVAWYYGNSGSDTKIVGTKLANELGIYDLTGNVWEWCWDWSGDYSADLITNPTGSTTGTLRAKRGGSWNNEEDRSRISSRGGSYPDAKSYYSGLRLARSSESSIPQTGLVAEYLFEGNANDTSGNGNDGTVYGATLTADRDGNLSSAYSFDGSNDYIEINGNLGVNLGSSGSFWFNVSDNEANSLYVSDYWHSTSGVYSGFAINYMAPGYIYLGIGGGSGALANTFKTENLLATDEWIHVYFAFNSVSAVKCYINGIEQSIVPIANDSFSSVSFQDNNDRFGATDYAVTDYLNGSLDDIRIYNRALTESEITALYNE